AVHHVHCVKSPGVRVLKRVPGNDLVSDEQGERQYEPAEQLAELGVHAIDGEQQFLHGKSTCSRRAAGASKPANRQAHGRAAVCRHTTSAPWGAGRAETAGDERCGAKKTPSTFAVMVFERPSASRDQLFCCCCWRRPK